MRKSQILVQVLFAVSYFASSEVVTANSMQITPVHLKKRSLWDYLWSKPKAEEPAPHDQDDRRTVASSPLGETGVAAKKIDGIPSSGLNAEAADDLDAQPFDDDESEFLSASSQIGDEVKEYLTYAGHNQYV